MLMQELLRTSLVQLVKIVFVFYTTTLLYITKKKGYN